MRICAISDQHGNLPQLPESDICLIAGDILPTINHNIRYQADWLNNQFKHWANSIKTKKLIYTAGNHDFVFQHAKHLINFEEIHGTYLEDTSITVEGLVIHGSPHQLPFYDWAFNLPEEELDKKWGLIPHDTDILLLHGPPYGYGDLAPAYPQFNRKEAEHVGSKTLINRIIERPNIKAVIFGHIHSDRGIFHIPEMPDTFVANVGLLNEKYVMDRAPTEFVVDKSN